MTGKQVKDEKKDEGPAVELDVGSKLILQELEKHLDKCVGEQCDSMRKELRAEIQAGKLDEAAIKKITDDLHKRLGAEVTKEYTDPIKGMNNRMSQFGLKVDQAVEKASNAVEEAKVTSSKIEKAVADLADIKETVKAPMGRLEELEKARMTAETAKLQAEKDLAERSKAALERAEAEKAKAAAAPPSAATPTPSEPCPNCQYDPTKGTPKITAGCPKCKTSFTKHETDPPAQDAQGNAIGGQGYKNCPGCGSLLVPVTELRTKKAPAVPKPVAAPAAPQVAAAQPKAQ